MGRYRKKPVVVEAIQWLGDNYWQVVQLVGADGDQPRARPFGHQTLTISTLEGDMKAMKGDWIIKGVKGEVYPCKPDIFEQTYEAVDADPD